MNRFSILGSAVNNIQRYYGTKRGRDEGLLMEDMGLVVRREVKPLASGEERIYSLSPAGKEVLKKTEEIDMPLYVLSDIFWMFTSKEKNYLWNHIVLNI